MRFHGVDWTIFLPRSNLWNHHRQVGRVQRSVSFRSLLNHFRKPVKPLKFLGGLVQKVNTDSPVRRYQNLRVTHPESTVKNTGAAAQRPPGASRGWNMLIPWRAIRPEKLPADGCSDFPPCGVANEQASGTHA